MLLNIFTFSSSEKTPQYKKKILGHSQHPRIHCTGRVKYSSTFLPPRAKKKKKKYGSTRELLINVDP